ncbi:MAG: KTSC domain-containing protein [Thermoanaerobaculia bacterium]
MRRERVSSSAISSVGYDPKSSVLEVEFSSGIVYDYFGVPSRVFRQLMKAPSIGSFVSRRIRDRYEFARREH